MCQYYILFSVTLYWPYYNFMKCFGFDEVVGLGLEKCSLGKCWTWEAFYAFHFSIYTKSTELDKLIHSINFWCLRFSALHAIIWLKVAHPWVLTLSFICVKGFSLTCEILASKAPLPGLPQASRWQDWPRASLPCTPRRLLAKCRLGCVYLRFSSIPSDSSFPGEK